MRRTKVRFSLQKGDNYMKWRIIHSDGSVRYYNPNEVQLIMIGCTLKNNKKIANKIFRGETNKTVCAWIMCDDVQVIYSNFIGATPYKIYYNPRKEPNWVIYGKNADNTFRNIIYSVGKDLLCGEWICDSFCYVQTILSGE